MSDENENLYKCEACGSIYEDIELAENCERKCKEKKPSSDDFSMKTITKSKFNLGHFGLFGLVLIIIVGFGLWQYLEKDIQEKISSFDEEQKELNVEADLEQGIKQDAKSGVEESEEIVKRFMEERIKADSLFYTFLPENVKIANTDYGIVLTSFSKIVLTTPRLASYEIVDTKKVDSSKIEISTKSYLENEKGEKVGYYDESFTVDSKNNRPIVFVKQSDYKSLVEEDECKNFLNLSILEERDHCYFRTAFERGDTSFCDKIVGISNKSLCYMVVALRNNDFSICQQHPEILSLCAFRFGVSNRDETFCDKSTSNRNLCLYRVAVVKNQPSVCAKITDDYRNSRVMCENYFQETKEDTFGGESIRIIRPKSNQEISSPVKIEGRYIGKIYIKIEDDNKNQLALESIETKSGLPFYYPFSISLSYTKTSSEKGVIKIFTLSEKDAITRTVVIPVNFKETPLDLPQPVESSGWKVYRNEEDGYEIEYPSDWSHSSSGGIIHDFCNLAPFEGVEFDCGPSTVDISLRNDVSDGTSPEYCVSIRPSSILCMKSGVTIQNIVVDGREGKLFEVKTGNIHEKHAFWKKSFDDEVTYELNVRLINHPEYKEIFNKILSSFRFIKDDHPLLSESQEDILETFGIDVSSLPRELTPEMEQCFIDKLGQERVNEILEGATPNVIDFFKAKSCI